MQVEVVLPDLDEGNAAVFTVERWMCSVGMSVRVGEPLLQVRSGSTLHLVPAPVTGCILLTRVQEGAKVRAGAVLAILDSDP